MTIEKLKKSIRFKAKNASFLIEDNVLKIDDLIIDSPGEYEKSGIFVHAVKAGVFSIIAENTQIIFAKKTKKVSPELGGADLLLTDNKDLIPDLEAKNSILIKDLDKITIKDGNIKKDSK